MNLFGNLIVFALLILLVSAEEPLVKVQYGNAQFTSSLLKVLSDENRKINLFFSPISVHSVLSMIYQGAQGSTVDVLAKTLKVSKEVSAQGYEATMQQLNSISGLSLSMANKVFLKDGLQIKRNFLDSITKNFHSEVQSIDFAKNVEAANTINRWVEQQTKNKITNLVNANDLDGLTRSILANAIYFRGQWASKFRKEFTQTEPFHVDSKTTVHVKMMKIWDKEFKFKFDVHLGAQVVEVPYINRNVSMVIILPFTINGIDAVETKLSNLDLGTITRDMYSDDIVLNLPKFTIKKKIDLRNPLIKLGLGEIFDEGRAQFGGITDSEKLYVSSVVQKAFIEVNEEGAEAAAATEGKIQLLSAPPEMVCDHPFIFFIKSGETILFLGKIMDPTQ